MKEVYRELITPDGTILISRYKWDYITYTDDNGKKYMLDGGINNEYYRCSVNGDEIVNTIHSTDDFEIVRQYMFRWNPFEERYFTLQEMSDEWLENVISFYLSIKDEKRNGQIDDEILCLYIKEKQFRAELWN